MPGNSAVECNKKLGEALDLALLIAESMGAKLIEQVGYGNYNVVFKLQLKDAQIAREIGFDVNDYVALKIPLTDSRTDHPDRLVRLWNQVNAGIIKEAATYQYNQKSYFVSPFVNGRPIFLKDESEEVVRCVCRNLIEVYDSDENGKPSHRILVDACSDENQVVIEINGEITIVTVDFGLLFKLGKNGSQDSLETLQDLSGNLDKYFSKVERHSSNNRIIVKTIKTLLFLSQFFSEVKKVSNPIGISFPELQDFFCELYNNHINDEKYTKYLANKLVLQYYSDQIDPVDLQKISVEIQEVENENPALSDLSSCFIQEKCGFSDFKKRIIVLEKISEKKLYSASIFQQQLSLNKGELVAVLREKAGRDRFIVSYLKAIGCSESELPVFDDNQKIQPYFLPKLWANYSGSGDEEMAMRINILHDALCTAEKLGPPSPIDFSEKNNESGFAP